MPSRTGLAVIDLGSNSFRLVVFEAGDGWWRRTDEIYEPVRIGQGLMATGRLGEEPMERALATLDVFAHFCRASGLGAEQVDAVATSAIRDAENAEGFLVRARERFGLPIRVLSREEEAHHGYLAAVNSTTLSEGCVLDLGGGSMQLVRVLDRREQESGSWRLGTVRMSERFLPPNGPAKRRQLAELREYIAAELAGVASLEDLIERLASLPAAERASVPGIKPARADLILAGAVAVREALRAGGFEAIETTEAGLREGVFFERLLGSQPGGPLFSDVRRASVLNMAAQYRVDGPHTRHVATLALSMFDELARLGLHDGDPRERELLWAACMLHDIGMSIDYDDHHKHSRYLILNGGLPGFEPVETAIIAQAARYHRKGMPSPGPMAPLFGDGDVERLDRCAALLRLAEDLERSRDQLVRGTDIALHDGEVQLRLIAEGDPAVPRWAAGRGGELFARALHR